MGKFYHLNSTKVTLKEFLFGSPWYQLVLFLLPVLLLVKVFRVNVPNSTDDPIVESVDPFEVDPAAIPYEIHQRFQRFSGELTALGFQSPIYHMIIDPLRSTRIYWVTLVHSSGKHIARIHNRVWTGINKNDRGVFPIFCTPYVDGTFTVSSAGKPDMLSPASAHVEHHVGASVQQLWERHQLSVEKSGKIPASVGPDDGLRRMIGNWHKVVRDFHIERGVFTPLSEDEEQQLASASAVSGMENIPQEDREVFNHIQRIQNQKTSVKKMIPLLVISLILFIIAGRSNRSMDLLMIIPVLAFHELGHFIAMKAFRYTNISMFFIPFLGAAVTGQHYNVPGWKKAIVALAGPVPGILLGIVIGVIAKNMGGEPLYILAVGLVGINAL
ncbi:MAG TPA: site-2 protease family protein, partial [Armatimonadota bacterium]